MLTYNNDPKFKKAFVAEAVKHERADSFLQGTYGQQNGRPKMTEASLETPMVDPLGADTGEEMNPQTGGQIKMETKKAIETCEAIPSIYMLEFQYNALRTVLDFCKRTEEMLEATWEIHFFDPRKQLARVEKGRWNAVKIGVSTQTYPDALSAFESLEENR